MRTAGGRLGGGLTLLAAAGSLALVLARPAVGAAAGIAWSGYLQAQESAQELNSGAPPLPDRSPFSTRLQLKLELDGGEPRNGVVILRSEAQGETRTTLQQGYLNLFLPQGFLLRLGRQKLAWGTGFAWNPTNYVGAGKNRADLGDERAGVDAVTLETNREGPNWAFVLKSGDRRGDGAAAARTSLSLAGADLSLSGYTGYEQGRWKQAAGGDVAAAVGDWVVYGEAAWQKGSGRPYVTRTTGAWEIRERADSGYLHAAAGAYRLSPSNLFTLVELYRNQEGWSARETEDYRAFLADPAVPAEVKADPRLAGDTFADLRQDYLFCLVRQPGVHENWTLAASAFVNLDDRSWALTPEVRYDLGQNAYLLFTAGLSAGEAGAEFASLPVRRQYDLKAVLNF